MQDAEQKKDMAANFKGFKNYKNLDYIAIWFKRGADYINDTIAKAAFVSTNSICQGEQVGLLWPYIFDHDVSVQFAYRPFKWQNSAKQNAAVIVVVIGLSSNQNLKNPIIYKDGIVIACRSINAHLIDGEDIWIFRRKKALSNLPEMVKGNQPTDGGFLILDRKEKKDLLDVYPDASVLVKNYLGSKELINGLDRNCLWINHDQLGLANSIPPIRERIIEVEKVRLLSKAPTTRKFSGGGHRFIQIQHEPSPAILVPEVSSERREYIPIGLCGEETVASNKLFTVYGAEPNLLSKLISKMHMVWMQTVSGRLKMDYSYSSVLCFNTFPFPPITLAQEQTLTETALGILAAREMHPGSTLADLYDPDKMPDNLREAHRTNDLAVEACYRAEPFTSDEERLAYLFKLYEEMIAAEKEKDTLFAIQKKAKKTRKTKK
jgi:hypothetical protein